MPTYEYYCKHCKIIFESLLISRSEVKKYKEVYPCKTCGKKCNRVPSASNFQFKGISEGDPTRVGNSGVHDLDYPSLDKAIGRSANRKWKEISKRKKVRDKVRQELGTNSIGISQDGTIVPIDKKTISIRNSAFKTLKKARDQNGD